ncbi:fibroblast growth factor-binding protein 1-like [Pseudoliparis swirei]|uniref:fibroblast growth factor-binding protein 1-like n=1 Tax=Pseudoliparis swirei TaxID=2059687 RepID=UPI0024BDC073|nr:fibroblast growth factor-binding protein 1-like [Pseudoliparis swirei]
MLLLKTSALWLLLAFLGQQLSLSCAARNKNRAEDQTVTTAPGRVHRSRGKPAEGGRGKFSIKDKMRCTWSSTGVGDTVRLSVKCEDREARVKGGVTDLQCHYNAKPQSCPAYLSDTKGFWKQVARALKRRQGNVCEDDRKLLRAGMCKRAPRDAGFKLDPLSSVRLVGELETPQPPPTTPPPPRSVSTAAPPAGPTACTRRANHWQTAEESCSGSWASVCNFLLSMLQSDDC